MSVEMTMRIVDGTLALIVWLIGFSTGRWYERSRKPGGAA